MTPSAGNDDRREVLIRELILHYEDEKRGVNRDFSESMEANPTERAYDFLFKETTEGRWHFLEELISRAPQHLVGRIGAGFLEDFVESEGNEFIDRIEQSARANPKIQEALGSVIVSSRVSPVVVARLKKVQPLLASYDSSKKEIQ